MKNLPQHGGLRPGSGRPKGSKRKAVNVSLLPATLQRIDTEAFQLNCSRGEVIDKWEKYFSKIK